MADKIIRYTDKEGGPWLDWPPMFFYLDDVDDVMERFKPADPLEAALFAAKSVGSKLVQFYGPGPAPFFLHSFATNMGREWDAINGWRARVEAGALANG